MRLPPPPSPAAFVDAYEAGRPQLLWTSAVADLETPVSAYLKLADGRCDTFLLESVEGGAVRGRYSIIGIDPDLVFRIDEGVASIERRMVGSGHAAHPGHDSEAAGASGAAASNAARVGSDGPDNSGSGTAPDEALRSARERLDEQPLDALRRILGESAVPQPPGLPPMASGLVGYLGYETVRLMERIPRHASDPLGLPEAVLLRPTLMAIFDNVTDALILVTPVRPNPSLSADQARSAAEGRLEDALERLARPLAPTRLQGLDRGAAPPGITVPPGNLGEGGYQRAVEVAKEYIRAGDAFQVVPSQRFRLPFALPPLAFYRALRRLNPSPFLFFLDLGHGSDRFAIAGSSPEILVRLRGGTVTIRPLAGTRPRGATHAEDQALEAELLADPKERAEHLMLLDLGRNDVGRVAELGSVKVTERFLVERYSHVMHIVSNVEGTLRPGLSAIDALVAGFPAGTLTGAPKVRAMEIIAELEPEARGVYGGAIGYFAGAGDMDTCIGLRTAVIKDGTLILQAGAGIVADSDPDAEAAETVAKARGLVRAAEEALRFGAAGD